MRKVGVVVLAAILVLTLCPTHAEAKSDRDPGGARAFLVGCLWGLREGTEWNEGANLHWREWCRLVPFMNVVVSLWDGWECARGITAHEWAEKNGANWY